MTVTRARPRLLGSRSCTRRSRQCGLLTDVRAVEVQGTTRGMRLIGRLIANAIVGLVLLFVTNLFLSDDVPVNLLTLVICAIGGVVGWLVIVLPGVFATGDMRQGSVKRVASAVGEGSIAIQMVPTSA